MRMLSDMVVLLLAGVATVTAVRFLMMPGIRGVGRALHFSPKTTGQVIGYVTSLPELTVLVASALSGVFEAGFWNIASSNIINCGLFIVAITTYRQHHKLKQRLFHDELAFVIASVTIPCVLAGTSVTLSFPVAWGLLALFVFYRVADIVLNRKHHTATAATTAGPTPSPVVALFLIITAIAIMIVSGRFLGSAAARLVEEIGVPGWALGWVLGVITSLPEMTSFFEVFRSRHEAGTIDDTLDSTQEALDALVASNMCNLALILPIGTICYLLVVGT